jgi:hypothetical protein
MAFYVDNAFLHDIRKSPILFALNKYTSMFGEFATHWSRDCFFFPGK